jgi:hypothetical protein
VFTEEIDERLAARVKLVAEPGEHGDCSPQIVDCGFEKSVDVECRERIRGRVRRS